MIIFNKLTVNGKSQPEVYKGHIEYQSRSHEGACVEVLDLRVSHNWSYNKVASYNASNYWNRDVHLNKDVRER